MPATYTYNDAIEDAKGVVAKAWAESSEHPEIHMKLMLDIIGRLGKLKRQSRRKRSRPVIPEYSADASIRCPTASDTTD